VALHGARLCAQLIPRFLPFVAFLSQIAGTPLAWRQLHNINKGNAMRRLTLALALSPALIIAGCVIVVPPDGNGTIAGWSTADAIQGNGSVSVENRSAAGATAVSIENRRRVDMEVDVRVGQAQSLQVEADSNLQSQIHTELSGDTLRVWSDQDLRSSRPILVHITLPQLKSLDATGSVRTDIGGLAGGTLRVQHTGSGRLEMRGRLDQLDLRHTGSGYLYADALESRAANVEMVGSGRVNIGSVRGEQLRLDSSGSGTFYARGMVRTLSASVQGSGGAQLNDLRADIADITSNGSGGVSAWVQQKVVAQSNGSGQVIITGNPAERSVSGRNTTVR
jgi:hypothetical protein